MKHEDERLVVYELWSDEDLRWIEIPCPDRELAVFLEAWCEKNSSIFRRRPWRAYPPPASTAAATTRRSSSSSMGR